MTVPRYEPARTYPSPVGPVPIRQGIRERLAHMTDREVADKALGVRHINPETYAELCHRGLSGPGVTAEMTYQAIAEREAHREQAAMIYDCGMGTVPGHWKGLRDWLTTRGIYGRLPAEQQKVIESLCEARAFVQEVGRDGPG